MNRPRISLEKHREAGSELKRQRDYLVKLATAPGMEGNRRRALAATRRAIRAVDELRAVLDDHLAMDWPEQFDAGIYYPGSQASAERAAAR